MYFLRFNDSRWVARSKVVSSSFLKKWREMNLVFPGINEEFYNNNFWRSLSQEKRITTRMQSSLANLLRVSLQHEAAYQNQLRIQSQANTVHQAVNEGLKFVSNFSNRLIANFLDNLTRIGVIHHGQRRQEFYRDILLLFSMFEYFRSNTGNLTFSFIDLIKLMVFEYTPNSHSQGRLNTSPALGPWRLEFSNFEIQTFFLNLAARVPGNFSNEMLRYLRELGANFVNLSLSLVQSFFSHRQIPSLHQGSGFVMNQTNHNQWQIALYLCKTMNLINGFGKDMILNVLRTSSIRTVYEKSVTSRISSD